MCIGAPKAPNLAKDPTQQIPIRQPVLLPDNGDPSTISALKNQRRLTTSAMILTGAGGTLGTPNVSGPIGSSRM